MLFHGAWTSFLLSLTALLPLINPLGSALIFVGLVGDQPPTVYRDLARKVGVATLLFLLIIEFLGSLILRFFGISLPVVQLTGGIVIAATAWSMLFQEDAGADAGMKHADIEAGRRSIYGDLARKIFYPLTFPITAGPGTLVVMLTLTARVPDADWTEVAIEHLGIAIAAVVLSATVYLCYGYAPRLMLVISPSTVHGILRVIAFILMCIGVQIAWNGLSALSSSLPRHR